MRWRTPVILIDVLFWYASNDFFSIEDRAEIGTHNDRATFVYPVQCTWDMS